MSTIDYMNECTVRDLVLMLMDERGMSLHEALDTVYNSETYAKLTDPTTGLYFQSPVYIYCYLDRELATGKMFDTAQNAISK